ncbi:MAG: DNA alkylation repair protein [Acholeplasmatales bacterium]|nr:DNA alkylation repair protein [Acholeplasmatales bacterium]
MDEIFKQYIDLEYKSFSLKIVPNTKILGIRSDNLKLIAKEYASNNLAYFNSNLEYHEEKMVYMFMLSYIKDVDLIYDKLDEFVPKIENWAQCDALLNIKRIKKNRDKFMPLVKKYRYSSREFESRFALIMLLSHYMDEEYLDFIFETIENLKSDKYYTEMAAAWLICECFIKHRDYTYKRFKDLKVSKFIFNKAIQKIKESYRVSLEDKEYLKTLKRK